MIERVNRYATTANNDMYRALDHLMLIRKTRAGHQVAETAAEMNETTPEDGETTPEVLGTFAYGVANARTNTDIETPGTADVSAEAASLPGGLDQPQGERDGYAHSQAEASDNPPPTDEESEVTTEFLSETEAAATVSSTTSTEPAPSPVDADDEAKPNCQ
jgi:hypothetical protein